MRGISDLALMDNNNVGNCIAYEFIDGLYTEAVDDMEDELYYEDNDEKRRHCRPYTLRP